MSHTARNPSAAVRSGYPGATALHGPGPAPAVVRAAFALWVTAVAAGAFETVLAIGRMLSDSSGSAAGIIMGLAVRLPVFTAAILVARRMRGGRGWARIALTLGLGVLGTASMVAQPIRALAQGHSLSWELAQSGPMDLLFTASRTVHVCSVLTAVVLMFLPAANVYFRATRDGGRASLR
ncbi:hypothetical protein OHS33_35930 [Streptomyces sp. NBC_00536]|uniref:hypothetical protein n=1 Tax=Streptomyces sp. NBC_00536 TaxID=2975769 RepID=UPI002E80192B|nr:hypothetical protein [Streptomyces sp. NBC_00536]WUC83297.1 hypothetical protein OHS33_35930 [Streptomyces sp. NBC_00536]